MFRKIRTPVIITKLKYFLDLSELLFSHFRYHLSNILWIKAITYNNLLEDVVNY